MILSKFKTTLIFLILGFSASLSLAQSNSVSLPSSPWVDSVQLQLPLVTSEIENTVSSFTNSCAPGLTHLERYSYCPFLMEDLENSLQKIRRDMRDAMERLLILSFSNTEDPLHRKLLHAIGPMAYIEDLTLVDKELPSWRFFFKFLKYYTPGTFNYNTLKLPEHKSFLDQLHNRYRPFLLAEPIIELH